MKHIILALTLCTVAAHAVAETFYDDLPYTDEYRACSMQAKTQTDELKCLEPERIFWDKEFDLAHKSYLANVSSKEEESAFIKAQKAWIAFRQSNCAFINVRYKASDIKDVEVAKCHVAMTLGRTILLYEWLEQ